MEIENKDNLNSSIDSPSLGFGDKFFNLIKWIQIGFILTAALLSVTWIIFIGPLAHIINNAGCSVINLLNFIYQFIYKFFWLNFGLFPILILYQTVFSF